jgi:hypothetical protein
MKKRTGWVILAAVLALSLCASCGLMAVSAAPDNDIRINPAGTTFDKPAVVPPAVGPQAYLPGVTTLGFEGLPDTYNYLYGGQNIGNYYPGVTIGPKVVVADAANGGYNDEGYPPHSGNAVFGTEDDNYADFVFDTPVRYVGGWFTFYSKGYMEAYDVADILIDSDSMNSNYGYNSYMAVSGTDIKRVRIHDEGGFFTGDDISYGDPPEEVPGLSQWGLIALIVLSGGAMAWLILRKQVRSRVR